MVVMELGAGSLAQVHMKLRVRFKRRQARLLVAFRAGIQWLRGFVPCGYYAKRPHIFNGQNELGKYEDFRLIFSRRDSELV